MEKKSECCTGGTKLIYSCSGASDVGEIVDKVARKNLEHIGVKPKSYILTEMGLVKGKTPATEQIICEIAVKIKKDSNESN